VDEEVARADAAKLAKAKRQAARKKEQKRRKKQTRFKLSLHGQAAFAC
jgi:hypothetical protein